MKKIIAIASLLFIINAVVAQTSEEWLKQKATQKKYLLQQIAALKVYTGHISKGYAIAKKGLSTISDFKDGDFNLHKDHFAALVTASPRIKRYTRVAAIISLEINMVRQANSIRRYCEQSGHLTVRERKYVSTVYDNLLMDCSKLLDNLFDIISNGSLSMKDDERINAIDELYKDMLDMQSFCRSFAATTKALCLQRVHEAHDIKISEKLNHLK